MDAAKTDLELLDESRERVAALEIELNASHDKVALLENDLAAANQLSEEAGKQVAALSGDKAKLEGEKLELNGKLESADKELEALKTDAAKARENAARFGAVAPRKTDAAQNSAKETLTRAEFDQLSGGDKAAFLKARGTLCD